VVCLVDIGVQTSTVNIVESGFLIRSFSFSFCSSQLTKAIASTLGISYEQAEEVKVREGIASKRPEIVNSLKPIIDSLLVEIKNISDEFFQQEKKQVEEVYLTGGAANLPGLKEYIANDVKKNIIIPNCFSGFKYPLVLGETLKELSPRFFAAVGVALARYRS
jgi:Tfp pilus assembly PilM family ATPase